MAKRYEDFDESEGVWRTVGGRKIFIREGQSLGEAMKASGKFKSAKKREGATDNNEGKKIDSSKQNSKKGIDPVLYAKDLKEPKTEYDKLAVEYKDTFDKMVDYNTQREELYEGFDEENAKKHLSAQDYKKYEELTNKYKEERKKLEQVDDKIEAYRGKNSDVYDKLANEYSEKRNTEIKKQGGTAWEKLERQQKEENELLKNTTQEGKERNRVKYNDEKKDELRERTNAVMKSIEANKPMGQKTADLIKESGVKTFADEIKEQEKKNNEKFSVDYFKKQGVEIKDKAPEGWVKLEGATTAPNGYEWYSNGKSRFGGEYKNALVKQDVWEKQPDGTYKANKDAMKAEYERNHKNYDAKIKQFAEDRKNMTNGDWEGMLMAYERQNADGTYRTLEDIMDDVDKYEKETKGNNQINNSLRRKAYQKYLKEHPNSELTFEDFIDMRK